MPNSQAQDTLSHARQPLLRGPSSRSISGLVLKEARKPDPSISTLVLVRCSKRSILIDDSWAVAQRETLGLSAVARVRRPSLLLSPHHTIVSCEKKQADTLLKKINQPTRYIIRTPKGSMTYQKDAMWSIIRSGHHVSLARFAAEQIIIVTHVC